MTEPYNIVIPARYASTRFPGKPLVEIAGKAMLHHVYDRACSSHAGNIIIATDDSRIADYCSAEDLKFCMTSAEHKTGTDRIAEVAVIENWSDDVVIVGLQGDEPATPPAIIEQVARNLHKNPTADIATLCTQIERRSDYLDPNRVKVVFDHKGFAQYFSRAPIPWRRDLTGSESGPGDAHFPDSFLHIGMYAYRARFLERYSQLTEVTYENEEKLEQLRALYHGFKIHIDVAETLPAHGVDQPDDVAAAEKALKEYL